MRRAGRRAVGLLLLGVVAVLPGAGGCGRRPPRDYGRVECLDNLRNLAQMLSGWADRRGWPALGGRNFVLSAVGNRLVVPRHPDDLRIFFCPHVGRDAIPGLAAYAAVTSKTLRERRFPHLTSHAGRRNDEPAWRLGERGGDQVEPILGCRYHGDLVVLAFSDGKARAVDREELGLAEGEPIVFGDGASHPWLRALSEE